MASKSFIFKDAPKAMADEKTTPDAFGFRGKPQRDSILPFQEPTGPKIGTETPHHYSMVVRGFHLA